MWLCWLHQVMASSSLWNGLQPSVKRDEFLPQVEEFKYLGVLFTSDRRREWEIDRWIGAVAAGCCTGLLWWIELSVKAKLSLYWSIYAPTLTYGHELWVVTETTRSQIQAAEMGFLRRVAGLSLRDRVRSLAIQEGLRVETLLLHIERSQLSWFGHLMRMPPERLLSEVFRACPTERRLQGRTRTRWRDYISWLAWEHQPRISWRRWLGRGRSGLLWLGCWPRNPALDKRKKVDGWMDGWMDG
ncbi:hepatocyte cell adhesion molecule [Sarotherodon galilaeus]